MATRALSQKKRGSGKKKDELTTQQRDFLGHMMKDLNMSPTVAARLSGYKFPNTSAPKLMNNPIIKRELGNALRQREERTNISADEVLRILYNALTLDPIDLFDCEDKTLTFKDLESIPKELRILITNLDVKTFSDFETGNTTTTIKISWVSKELALNLTMKHLGLLEERLKVEHSIDATMVTQLRNAIQNKGRIVNDDFIDGIINN